MSDALDLLRDPDHEKAPWAAAELPTAQLTAFRHCDDKAGLQCQARTFDDQYL
jgi:hypothetical protein